MYTREMKLVLRGVGGEKCAGDEPLRDGRGICSFNQVELRNGERFTVRGKGTNDCVDIVLLQHRSEALHVRVVYLNDIDAVFRIRFGLSLYNISLNIQALA